MPTFSCPVCASTSLSDFRARKSSKCADCGALERTRMMWLALQATGLLNDTIRIAHFAPEKCLMAHLAPRYGARYQPFDIDPARYENPHTCVGQLDLCSGLIGFSDGAFDLIMHNHVLEHLPCDLPPVLRELDRLLAPGGTHIFTVPFHGDETIEDLDLSLSGREREERFLQHDHMRMFGARDFPALLHTLWQGAAGILDIAAYFSPEELSAAAIRPKLLSHIRGSTLFIRQKPGGAHSLPPLPLR